MVKLSDSKSHAPLYYFKTQTSKESFWVLVINSVSKAPSPKPDSPEKGPVHLIFHKWFSGSGQFVKTLPHVNLPQKTTKMLKADCGGGMRVCLWVHRELTLNSPLFQRTPDSGSALADLQLRPLSRQLVTLQGPAHRTGLLESFPLFQGLWQPCRTT